MRKPSRVNPQFLAQQKDKRVLTEDTPSSQNSIPDLRNRLNNLEELLGVKSYTVTP